MKTLRITPKKKYTIHSVSLTLRLVTMIYFELFIFSAISQSQTDEWTVYNIANSGMPYNGVIELVIDMQGKYCNVGSRDNLLGKGSSDDLREAVSPQLLVNSETPPAFLWHTRLYEDGVHGVGLETRHPWYRDMIQWLDDMYV